MTIPAASNVRTARPKSTHGPGAFSFFDWKAYEAVGSTPKPRPNQTDDHPKSAGPSGPG
jgi:hypothetical protein